MQTGAASCALNSSSRRVRRRPERLIAAFGAAIVVLCAAACSGGGSSGDTSVADPPVDLSKLTEVNTSTTVSGAPLEPRPNAGSSTGEVIHPRNVLPIYDRVNGKAFAKLPTTQIGGQCWVPVIAKQGDWAEILLPSRPNGAAGWVHLTPGAADAAQDNYIINVNRAAFTLELLESGKSLGKWTIGTGKSVHPTPVGQAYIIAAVEETVDKYSPIILPLSYHSNSLETFGGGPGTVGIHTWPTDSFLGNASSDGCIRVTKEVLDKLVKLPLGTIVNIT